MHAVESRDLIRQVIFEEISSESPIELFIAVSPVNEGRSKVLANHFDFCIPLVARLATGIPTLIERCVRCASRHLVREFRIVLGNYPKNSPRTLTSQIQKTIGKTECTMSK